MKLFKPPTKFRENLNPSIFLAGSIEMGVAEDWQTIFSQEFNEYDVNILNPRRDDWDSSWKQEIGNTQFNEQVTWELDGLADCDIAALYLDPATKSPISLLELGLFCHTGKLIVCCPKGFFRKGNVDIVCKRYGISECDTFEELIIMAKEKLDQL